LRTTHDNTRVLTVDLSGTIGLDTVQATTRPPRTSLGKGLVQSCGPDGKDGDGENAENKSEDLERSHFSDVMAVLLCVHVIFEPSCLLLDGVVVAKVDESHLVVVADNDGVDKVAGEILLGDGLGVLGLLGLVVVGSEVFVTAGGYQVQVFANLVDIGLPVILLGLVLIVVVGYII
jgi:hypothetical protein